VKCVGVLGGGQLARMLALAGHPLGVRLRVFDPTADAPAGAVAEHVRADWGDAGAIERFCDGLDAATLEFESVPIATARAVAARVRLAPSADALAATQDRLAEKELARRLGIETAGYAKIDRAEDIAAAWGRTGGRAVLKQRTMGYDGRGQAVVASPQDTLLAWESGGRYPSVLEKFVTFERELSLVAARSTAGETAAYPLVENVHREGMLRRTLAPAPGVQAEVAAQAASIAEHILRELDYVGVITLEFFEKEGRLLLNEIAPRVHNSGHWSIEGSQTSQFENHLRAVLGWPLGSTRPVGCSALLNIIGTLPDTTGILGLPDTHLHLYGKEPRRGRKLGHVTARADDRTTLENRIRALEQMIEGAATPRDTEGGP